jgi:hypothetical protein
LAGLCIPKALRSDQLTTQRKNHVTGFTEKIETLEQQLLALTSINDICQRSMNDSSRAANLSRAPIY